MKQEKVSIVIFGGTGDLTKRKLVPAFAALLHKGRVSNVCGIIGIARGNYSDESYKELLINSVKDEHYKKYIRELKVHFFRGDASQIDGIRGLGDFLKKIEQGVGHHHIFYLATTYQLFPSIVRELRKQNLHSKDGAWTRIVFEKPFGSDLTSSNFIEGEIHKVFAENEIFRIDHYLAKETVQNLAVLKFTNPLFEGFLNSRLIEKIEVIVDEDLGVGDRLGYYHEAGAIKDMIQNHLLQVLSLVLMERPDDLDAKHIHDEKVKMLSHLKVGNAHESLLGQYQSYEEEAKKVNLQSSRTETFARIALHCNHPKWNGTKIILRTGKKLERKYGQIVIHFKSIDEHLKKTFKGLTENKIIIDLHPRQDIQMILNNRKPGSMQEVESVKFEFSHEAHFGPNTVDEYATLLGDVLQGEMTLFARSDEVKESWRLIEELEKIKDKIPFVIYPDHTNPEKIVVR